MLIGITHNSLLHHDYNVSLIMFVTAMTPAGLHSHLSLIPALNGSNFCDWHEQLLITLGCLDLDLVLRIDKPNLITVESTDEQKDQFEKWERSNRLSLMIIKSTIAKNIRGSVSDNESAKIFLDSVKQQFSRSDKAMAGMLTNKLTSMKYDGSSGVRKHIMEMSDIARKLKTLGMSISESFLVMFVLNSLPPQFSQFKISYNTHKETWTLNELISMCVQEEERLKQEGLLVINYASTSQQRWSRKRKEKKFSPTKEKEEGKKQDDRCHFCKKKGHFQVDCQKRKN